MQFCFALSIRRFRHKKSTIPRNSLNSAVKERKNAYLQTQYNLTVRTVLHTSCSFVLILSAQFHAAHFVTGFSVVSKIDRTAELSR